MPPRKATAKMASQQSLAGLATVSAERKPLPAPEVPTQVEPLWDPPSIPRELFPEWPATDPTLAAENWYTEEAPYEDPTALSTFETLLTSTTSGSIKWKRPKEFLPPIVPSSTAASLAPVIPDLKNAKKAAAPAGAGKKNEPEPPKKPPTKHAHIVYVESRHEGNSDHHHAAAIPATPDPKKHATPHPAGHPTTPSAHLDPPPPCRLMRDFRRLWSPEQLEELAAWKREEERIEREKESRERVYMDFEDATAFIVNERPRKTYSEDDVDADDLIDDGDDGELEADTPGGATCGPDDLPFGVLPPPRIEIAPNAVVKPEVPHGDVVHPEMASLFRVVDHLYQHWVPTPSSTPYMWQAIYPQDANGVPIYNRGGKYSVKLFVMGKWRRVDVDDRLPVDDAGYLQIVSSAMKNEIWPAIIGKAILKVVDWLGGCMVNIVGDSSEEASREARAIGAMRLANITISAMTGWKVTRHDTVAPMDGQSLLAYVPSQRSLVDQNDEHNELVIESDDAHTASHDEPVTVPHQPKEQVPPSTPKPRVVISCCATDGSVPHLSFREVAVLTDVVGDPGNATLKIMNTNGAASMPEDILSTWRTSLLIVHPPSISSDLILESWSKSGENQPVPFANPPVQLCSVKMPKRIDVGQSAGDTSGEGVQANDVEHIDIIVTLTRVSPVDASQESTHLAQLLNVDPNGSVILVEDVGLLRLRARRQGRSMPTRPPMVFKVDTVTSSRLRLPIGDYDDLLFRVYPQATCRYGYSIQFESSDAKVDCQIPSTCWRNLWDLQVIKAEGSYPVLRANSWNIIFKQTIELALPEGPSSPADTVPELYIDLQLFDPSVASFVHVYIVNNQTNEIKLLPGVHTRALFPGAGQYPPSLNYTVVVECSPSAAAIPEGKWNLTLGSTMSFKSVSLHQPKMTAFGDVYTPNKSLTCFRDVVIAPKKSSCTSLQLELVDESGTVDSNLALKLEVVDLASGHVLSEITGMGMLRQLHLPAYTPAPDDINGEKCGYIIQGSIDKTLCYVPDHLRSVRPFTNRSSTTDSPEKTVATINEADEPSSDSLSRQSSAVPGSMSGPRVKWRLTCWSTDDVKLENDRAQELRYDAIRTAWAEAAKDRDTHAAGSRLLFLGKLEAAETAMRDDGLSDDLIAKYKARNEWLEMASTKLTDGPYLQQLNQVPQEQEYLRSPDDYTRDEESGQNAMSSVSQELEGRREARVTARDTRAQELKDFIHAVREQRAEMIKHRQTLYAQRDDIIASMSPPPTAS